MIQIPNDPKMLAQITTELHLAGANFTVTYQSGRDEFDIQIQGA
jgi:hypothetical protein